MTEPRTLQTWKQIADYMSRGVRTVQRWERSFGLPVHRPAGRSRSAVLAMPEELDKWLLARPTLALETEDGRADLEAEIAALRAENEMLRRKLRDYESPTPLSIDSIAA